MPVRYTPARNYVVNLARKLNKTGSALQNLP